MKVLLSPVNHLMRSQSKSFQIALLFGFLLLVVAQLAFLGYLIRETSIAGPVQDSWGIVPYLKQTLANGKWFSAELWIPQNSHRLVLLRLEFLIDYFYFHGSNNFLVTLSCLLIAVESALFAWALNLHKKQNLTQWIIFLSAILFITFPTIAWSFLHIFNIHMVQCAFFVLLSCALVSKGLSENKYTLFVAGVVAAMICNFATFSISTIWPALFILLILNRANKYQVSILAVIAIIFSYAYINWLPTLDNDGNNYAILDSLVTTFTQGQDLYSTASITVGLLKYLVVYLSIPPLNNLFLQSITFCTLIWFVFACYNAINKTPSEEEKTALSLMAFGICLGITTGIGRGHIGDLSIGDRFQPMVLVYWAGFVIHFLHRLNNDENKFLFNSGALVVLCFISITGFVNAIDASKKLTEDYTRFAKMQMAYLSGNLGENAIYENVVPEWRKNSYAGIVALIPFLKENQLGVFNTPLSRYIARHDNPESKQEDSCLIGILSEKIRNNDPLIRNITFESKNGLDAKNYPYLLFYTDNQLAGIAFKKRLSLQQLVKETRINKSTWVGIVRSPSSESKTVVIAFQGGNRSCQAAVTKFSAATEKTPL